jgi:hypothetical protein
MSAGAARPRAKARLAAFERVEKREEKRRPKAPLVSDAGAAQVALFVTIVTHWPFFT